MISKMISLSDPELGNAEKRALLQVIDSTWLTMGPRVAEFERAFAALNNATDAVAVNSCTAGLHLGLIALGVGPGDEVLVPSLTFVATVNAVLYTGATPVFVDIQSVDRPHMSITDATAKVTARTKAVMIMHYGGYLMDLPAWRRFADDRQLYLIEDAAHAPAVGQVGSLCDVSTFSFASNKNITTAEGGMIMARDKAVLNTARQLRAHGMTQSTLDRHHGHAFSYDVVALGYNYRLDELRAAVGLVQLPRLLQWNARRRALSDVYRHRLAELGLGVVVPFERNHETAAHLMSVVLPATADREDIMSRLRLAGVQSSIHYPPVHRFTHYQTQFPGTTLPNTEAFCARELTLPLHPGLSRSDVERVTRSLEEAMAQCGSTQLAL